MPSSDRCACGCPCLNGPVQVVLAQVLLFVGAVFSISAMSDCSFVTAPISYDHVDEELDGAGFEKLMKLLPAEGDTRRLGMIFFGEANGDCYWYDDESNEKTWEAYQDFLGDRWNSARNVGLAAATLGWILVFYSWSFSCVAHPKPIRYVIAALASIVLAILQGVTFVALGSDSCDAMGCEFSRSAGYSIGAILGYFYSGMSFLLMQDYPGASNISDAHPKTSAVTEQHGVGGHTVYEEESHGVLNETEEIEAEEPEVFMSTEPEEVQAELDNIESSTKQAYGEEEATPSPGDATEPQIVESLHEESKGISSGSEGVVYIQ